MKKSTLYLLLEIALCLLCALIPRLLALWPQDVALVLAWCFSHMLYPACALFTPLMSARKGTEPFLCALPPFLIYLPVWLLFGLNPPAVPAILSLVLAVLGANIGAEIRKRSKKER